MCINLHDCFIALDRVVSKFSGGFIWASEKTGYRHLYVHDANGNCLGPLSEGGWMVEQIAGVDEAAGLVYFTETLDGPLESNLYYSKLFIDDNQPLQTLVRLTCSSRKHVIVLVEIHDSLDSPPKVLLCSLQDGSLIMPLRANLIIPKFRQLQLEPPEIVQVQANDGTMLYGALYKPGETRFRPPPYRTLISVYGRPSVQIVSNSWVKTVDMRAQYLRSKGILVWKLDTRGTARCGLKFEGSLKYKCGRVDADDSLVELSGLSNKG